MLNTLEKYQKFFILFSSSFRPSLTFWDTVSVLTQHCRLICRKYVIRKMQGKFQFRIPYINASLVQSFAYHTHTHTKRSFSPLYTTNTENMHRSVDFPNARMNCCNCKNKGCKGCRKCAPVPLTKVQLKKILQTFDTNGDCRLSKQELRNAFYYIGSHFPNWRASQALNRADCNDDGYISEGEMDGLVHYVWQCGYTIT